LYELPEFVVDKIDIKHMRIFLQLVRERNASKVAAQAGISQQAISGYLKRLRDAFPHEIFLRQSSGLQPTDFALELASKFERVLAEVDDLLDSQPFDPRSEQRTVTIVANEYAQLALVPKIVFAVRHAAPGVDVRIVDFDQGTHADFVAQGDADVVIGFADFLNDGLVKRPLREEVYCCVAGKGEVISDTKASVEDIARLPFVDFAHGGSHFRDAIDSMLGTQRHGKRPVATLPCYTALQPFLQTNDDVIAFVPADIARVCQMRVVELDFQPPRFDVSLAWHRRASGSPLRKWLAEVIVGCV
jgi:DNA-binding transcriptional LysR family regulator